MPKAKNWKERILSFLVGFFAFFLIATAMLDFTDSALILLSIPLGWFVGKLSLLPMHFIDEKRKAKLLEKELEQQAKAEAAEAEKKKQEKFRSSTLKRFGKSFGPEIDAILAEGDKALAEMGKLYSSIKDPDVKQKINELMRVTDKITVDAIDDPSDIPQIRRFMGYYLPTTIKLLHSYDRMSSQGINGENIDKSMDRINEMLDVAIDAYKKRLDSLYANNALDIETDIDVLNQMLTREGLTGGNDFDVPTYDSTQVGQFELKLDK